jgi:hypothetical protein
MPFIYWTLLTVHDEISSLKALAEWNIAHMVVTRLTSHDEISSSNEAAFEQ